MELDLSKYPLQELYKRFEEVEQKEANVSKFEKTVLDEKVKLQNFEGFSLDDLENLIDGNEVISHDQLNLLTKKLESVSRELKDIKIIFQSEVPVYIHFETRRRFRKSGLEASYKKTIKHIIKEFEKLRSIEKEVQEINDKIVKEISNKHSLSGCRTELELNAITPLFKPEVSGEIYLNSEIKKAKEFLGKTMLGHEEFYKYLDDNSLIAKLK